MNCKAIGYDMKSLQVELQHGETFYCERGAIIYYEDGLNVKLNLLEAGIGNLLKRAMSGESPAHLEINNNSGRMRKLMVAGKVGLLPLDLKAWPGGIVCRGGYYIASTGKVDFDFKLSLSSFIGGTGPAFQKLNGTCTVFLDSIGSSFSVELGVGEMINVDEKSFICMSASMQQSLKSNFSLKNMVGGEGLNMFQVSGPGTIYMNSVNLR